MSITPLEIKKIGKLSRIALNDDDITYYQGQLNGIFNWISALQSVDVSNVDLTVDQTTPQMHERQDVVTAPNRVSEVLSNAPTSAHEMFSVPKVVE
ncbi:MAG: Asp-tRNA(Asn)/Glu-tRNA(Gln) amidotransferase subunit GatC [Candidatus Paracaedibacteraceae bacterium]|nr:Asp-tRNA(Asn)/Glu-tRNA(Gln) amidotransferase subunit GatC [Candidatus Paracaedibacteraceae bacterium]